MLTVLKRFLVFFLVILQLIAPLVHAHTSPDIFHTGLHLPGLEMLSAPADAPETDSVSKPTTDAGLIIGLDTGIEQQAIDLSDQFQPFAVLAHFAVPESRELSFIINFSPHHRNLSASSPLINPHSPRAPPFFKSVSIFRFIS